LFDCFQSTYHGPPFLLNSQHTTRRKTANWPRPKGLR
jgi:hypothetical protein